MAVSELPEKTYFTGKETHQISLRSPETHLLDDDWERLVLYWSRTRNVNADRILGKSALLSNGKGSNEDKVQDSDTSCLGLVELLATTACISYSNLLSGSVRFLESQLQAERHRSAGLRQEVEGLRKPLEHSDAYFLV